MPLIKVHRSELQERRHRRWYLKFRFTALLVSGVLLMATLALLIEYVRHIPA